jgi:hypothetical protein
MAAMTNDEAQVIISALAELEFPTVFEKSMQFALFKVCHVLVLFTAL